MTTVKGYCRPDFSPVRAAFERNFAERDEVGAAVALYYDGDLVADLWGGLADRDRGVSWTEETLVPVYSCTKALAGLCLHLLIDRSLLDLAAPVARYWPEFAEHGKSAITVGMVMSHQAALPLWSEPLRQGALLDWEHATHLLAQQAPLWEPGTAHGYHGVTLGFLEGELVRRITGRTIGQFLRDEICTPLGAEAWIGLPEHEVHRVATVYAAPPDPGSPFASKLAQEPDWFGHRMLGNTGGLSAPEFVNSPRRYMSELPASGGIATARALALIFAPFSLDGALNTVRLVDESALALMRVTQAASSRDLLLQIPTAFSFGFAKSWGARSLGEGEHVVIGEHAFGAPGLGGSIVFADPQARLSFAYSMNRHGPGTCLNRRGQSLIDTVYSLLGFRTNDFIHYL